MESEYQMNLNPRVVFITGANRGIGLEFVKQFLNLPTPPKTVFATCRDPENAKDLNDVASVHSNVKVLKLDMSDSESIAGLAKVVTPIIEADGINLLVNNAAVMHRNDIETADQDSMLKSFTVNVIGPLTLVQTLLPYLKQAAKSSTESGLSCNRAAIVNMTSRMGSIGDNDTGGRYPYRTSKAALNMLTKTMSIDLKPEGILCFCLHPGWVKTEMGGPNALIDTETSVSGMFNVMTQMNENSDIFVHSNGTSLPW